MIPEGRIPESRKVRQGRWLSGRVGGSKREAKSKAKTRVQHRRSFRNGIRSVVRINPGSNTGQQAVASPWKQAKVRTRKKAKTGQGQARSVMGNPSRVANTGTQDTNADGNPITNGQNCNPNKGHWTPATIALCKSHCACRFANACHTLVCIDEHMCTFLRKLVLPCWELAYLPGLLRILP